MKLQRLSQGVARLTAASEWMLAGIGAAAVSHVLPKADSGICLNCWHDCQGQQAPRSRRACHGKSMHLTQQT